MKFICPIKVNMNLHVLSKRKDNYHNLQSLVVFVGGGDVLSFDAEAHPQSRNTEPLQVNGPFAGAVPTDDTNSILRAHRAFEEAVGHPVAGRWHLEKTVPVGAGLGSASANAAGALRLLQTIHPLHEDTILSIGKTIGSDVPVCLLNQNTLMEGTGDHLTPTPDVKTPPLVIVFPNVFLSTKAMFDRLSLGASRFCDAMPISVMKDILATQNVFEPLACQQAPIVGEVLHTLRGTMGCRLARLSGSGSACFAVYKRQDQVTAASHDLKTCYPHMWVWPEVRDSIF
ncbi:MAG: 4-(cytidine 5'-diphospho)-2-C-methyl-D-erythritol kinase [Alphaproteobacteria bacterium]